MFYSTNIGFINVNFGIMVLSGVFSVSEFQNP